MKKKHKITLLVIGILLALSLMLSSSYALWVFNVSQESTNVMISDCFEITLTDNNPIGLSSSFPMKDGEGVKTTPYTFTIKNICNHPADFQINLETLNTSTIDEDFIKADLNGHITEYNAAESVETTISGARSAAMLYEDTLAVNGEKTYNLRIWVNEIATQEDVENKSYASKVSVKSVLRKQYAEGTLITGNYFNVALKKLADGGNPSSESSNTTITSIERSLTAPTDEDNAVNIAETGTTTPIYAWFDDGVIYIYSTLDKIYMNSNSVHMFYKMQGVTSVDLSYFDTSKVTNMYSMFQGMNSITSLDVSNFNTSNVIDMSYMFKGMSNLTNLDVSHFDTSNVTDMSGMFYGMNNLTSLDVSHFDTSNVTNMECMFYSLGKVPILDVSHFDTRNVTDMSMMFGDMSSIVNIDVSNFDTSKVTDMNWMFRNMSSLKNLDVSNFNTSRVIYMTCMFYEMSSLEKLDLSNFDTSQVTDMSYAFSEMKSLEYLNLSNFNTSRVESFSDTFSNTSNLKVLDISSFDTSSANSMQNMFYNMSNLTTIYVGNKWKTSKKYITRMFLNDYNLVGGAGTTYDANHTDAKYARVDDPANGKPGYFTYKEA